jgi:hypothetical protein
VTTIPDPQIYRAAADVIRTNGWIQGAFYRGGPGRTPAKCPVCLEGAVRIATSGNPIDLNDDGFHAVNWLESQVVKSQDRDAIDWNDNPDRTVDEVLAALEQAAVAAEAARTAQDGGVSCV